VKHDVAGRARHLADELLQFAAMLEERRAGQPKLAVMDGVSGRKPRYVAVSLAEHETRLALWRENVALRWAEVGGGSYNRRRGECSPWSLETFVARARIGGERLSLREVQRFFQKANTHAPGSPQALRIGRAIEADNQRMRAAGYMMSRGTG
jgi:hypothetical protein